MPLTGEQDFAREFLYAEILWEGRKHTEMLTVSMFEMVGVGESEATGRRTAAVGSHGG